MKIIQVHQESLIVCDNPVCDYKIENLSGNPEIDCSMYIDVNCPLCGDNLLTEKDHLDSLKVLAIINTINRYFGWLSLFLKLKTIVNNATIHVHNGVKIENNKTNENNLT